MRPGENAADNVRHVGEALLAKELAGALAAPAFATDHQDRALALRVDLVEGLLLEDVLREQVLLALPLKVTFREDCKGLCPQCGKNLNQEQCSCSIEVEDPRWAALKEVRGRLEH